MNIKYYLDKENNIYELKTDLEQLLVQEVIRLNSQRQNAIKILKQMKHCELLIGGKNKSNIDKLLEILGEEDGEDNS